MSEVALNYTHIPESTRYLLVWQQNAIELTAVERKNPIIYRTPVCIFGFDPHHTVKTRATTRLMSCKHLEHGLHQLHVAR